MNRNEYIIIAIEKGYSVDKDGNIFHKSRVLNPYIMNNEYKSFTVRAHLGKCRPVLVHRFQAYLKYGNKMFEKDMHVRHLDGNPLNNSFDNICIGTSSDNRMDIDPEIRLRTAINAASYKIKFSPDIIMKIKLDRDSGMTYKKLAIKYNSCKSNMHSIINKSFYAKQIFNSAQI